MNIRLIMAALAGVSASGVALAQSTSPSTGTSDGIGGLINSLANDIGDPFLSLVVSVAYLVAFWLAYSGLMAFVRASSEGHSHHRVIEGILKLAGCSILCALPDACGVGIASLFGSSGVLYSGSIATAFANHTTQDCLGTTGTAGVTCVAQNIATNMVPIFLQVAFLLMKVVGFAVIGMTVFKLAQGGSEHSRGLPEGWARKLTIGAVLCNFPSFFAAVESTLGLSNPTITDSGAQVTGGTIPSMLAYSAAGSGSALLQQYQDLIGWCFVILMMFGVIAVWRGVNMLKDHQTGDRQTSPSNAFIHIVAGTLLANGKVSTCLILTTMFGNGAGFCS